MIIDSYYGATGPLSNKKVNKELQAEGAFPPSTGPLSTGSLAAGANTGAATTTGSGVALASQLNNSAAQTQFAAQTAIDTTTHTENAAASSGASGSAIDNNPTVQRFLDLLGGGSPAKMMRAMFLAQEGLTEEDLKNMSPEDRAKIEDKIAQKIKDTLRQQVEQQKLKQKLRSEEGYA